ncbi:P-loop containing nucleoside triphosphate hydrolase protein [Pholiota molesta]|nr:P-loop containing nucleoside triphosphate hydrolase protein [Pholiota molesta]
MTATLHRPALVWIRGRNAPLELPRPDGQHTFIPIHFLQCAGYPGTHAGIGLSDPRLNYEVRKKLDAMNKLHSTGQSVGKSSLIEAISGISLPRDSGTCTRCPIECRLSRTDKPWQCIVSLRFIVDASGQLLGQVRNEQFGGIIYDKAEVEARIRRAQHAILNPHKTRESVLNEGIIPKEDSSLPKFSVNCVTLQISGPDVADLSFCDLPETQLYHLVTVACETDFENQGAHNLAKKYDPEGKRTIGVLTKPDRIPRGEENLWLPFIRDERERLENNWFCVKQPSSNERKSNMTWDQARQAENDFFSTTAPWSSLEDTYQQYLRTSNLVERLSDVLYDLIEARMPQIRDELDRSINDTRELLSDLPPPPTSDPRSEILTLLHKFSQDLAQQIEGVPDGIHDADEQGLIQAIRPVQEKFKRAIRATAPNFSPLEKSLSAKDWERPVFAPSLLVWEEGPAQDAVPKAPPIFVDEVLERARRARTRELPGHYPFMVQRSFIQSFVKQWSAPSEALCRSVHAIMLKHAKQLVQKHLQSYGQGRLAQQVRSILKQHFGNCLLRAEERVKWLLRLEDVPFSLNTHYLSNYTSQFLAHYKGAREAYLNTTANATIGTQAASPAPFQWTPNSFPGVKKSAQESFASPNQLTFEAQNPQKSAFGTPTAPNQTQAHPALSKVLSGLAELGLTGVKAEDLPKLLPPDPMEPALVIMADVRAYFQVAYKRFVDNVPLAIDVELVRGVETEILSVLYAKLGINGPDGDAICKELAQEGRKVAERRRDLTKKLERLQSARLELFAI